MVISYLREFMVLADTLNFSKASEILFISQPTLSRHIQIIEAEVGTTLFFRSKQTVKLTNAGNEFLREVKFILDHYDNVIEKLNDLKKNINLKIGILYYQKDPILSIIDSFKKSYPEINLDYFLGTPNEIIEVLLNDDIDIGASMKVEFINHDLLEFRTISTESLVIMLNEKHPLKANKNISLIDLKDESFVFVDDNFYRGYLKFFSRACKKYADFIPSKIKYVDDYEKMLLTVQTESIVAVVTENMKNVGCQNCVFIGIKEDIHPIERGFFFKKENSNPAITLFLKLFE